MADVKSLFSHSKCNRNKSEAVAYGAELLELLMDLTGFFCL